MAAITKRDDSAFTCPVCSDVAIKPKVTPCGHLFCADCLQQWLKPKGDQRRHTCPHCRERIDLADCKSAKDVPEFKMLLKHLDEQTVECTDCGWSGKYERLSAHRDQKHPPAAAAAASPRRRSRSRSPAAFRRTSPSNFRSHSRSRSPSWSPLPPLPPCSFCGQTSCGDPNYPGSPFQCDRSREERIPFGRRVGFIPPPPPAAAAAAAAPAAAAAAAVASAAAAIATLQVAGTRADVPIVVDDDDS